MDLLQHFDPTTPIEKITAADAMDFYEGLKLGKDKGGRGLAVATANLAASIVTTMFFYRDGCGPAAEERLVTKGKNHVRFPSSLKSPNCSLSGSRARRRATNTFCPAIASLVPTRPHRCSAALSSVLAWIRGLDCGTAQSDPAERASRIVPVSRLLSMDWEQREDRREALHDGHAGTLREGNAQSNAASDRQQKTSLDTRRCRGLMKV